MDLLWSQNACKLISLTFALKAPEKGGVRSGWSPGFICQYDQCDLGKAPGCVHLSLHLRVDFSHPVALKGCRVTLSVARMETLTLVRPCPQCPGLWSKESFSLMWSYYCLPWQLSSLPRLVVWP